MLLEQISSGESKTIEFKERITTHKNLIKSVCSFSNRNGGKIIIGINDEGSVIGIDQNLVTEYLEKIPNIITDSISPMVLPEIYTYTIEEKIILIIELLPGVNTPYYIKSLGKEKGTYIRVGKINKQADIELINNLERKRLNIGYDEDIFQELTDDIRSDLRSLLSHIYEEEINSEKLFSLGLVRKVGEIDYLTNGGGIVLGLIDHSLIRCARFVGDSSYEFMDRKEYDGNIFEQIKNATNFICGHLNVAGYFVKGDLRRRDELEIPYEIVREAVINAVLHRDYSMRGSDIKIAIYNSTLELITPGGLPGTVTVDEIYAGRSEIRNRVLAKVLLRAKLIEQWGSGIPRIREACNKKGYDLPILTESGMFVSLIIYRGRNHPRQLVRETSNRYGSFRDKDAEILNCIIDLIRQNEFITVKEISAELALTPATAQRKLKKLQELELINRIGSKKTGYWKIV